MNTTRNKRWNGKIETLKPDYLNDVMGKMVAYGDRVQFGLTGPGQRPNYQVINTAGKKMAFDSNSHLLQPKEDEFVGSNATGIFTLDQVKLAIAGGGKTSTTTRTSRVGSGSTRSSTATIKAKDLVDTAKYEYFKNNRQTLPASIGEYSDEITDLMKKGMSAEDAFGDVIKRYFE
ncbi:hypothetical protein [Paraherbaspirillum soli]|uniref:Uncharacterized protein n=1 Tax=Paraherbaspirillum soli TaxID=631222 RepID=A0ABW0MA19_9BURK